MKTKRDNTCRCSCCGVLTHHARTVFIQVPGDTKRRLLLKSHVEPYAEEVETIRQLVDLCRATYRQPIWRRWRARNRVRTLKHRSLVRLHGEFAAKREADRAALLTWMPQWAWLHDYVERHWQAQDAAREAQANDEVAAAVAMRALNETEAA